MHDIKRGLQNYGRNILKGEFIYLFIISETRLLAGQPMNRKSTPDMGKQFFSFAAFRAALGTIQLPINLVSRITFPGVRDLGSETDH
jgi:hypothetical protein